MSRPELVVMAAGIGSRFKGLKQIEPVGPNGEILIDYTLYDAHRAGFSRVAFIIRKEFEEEFKKRIGKSAEKAFDVSYAFQEVASVPEGFTVPPQRVKPWGTAHAVLCARNLIGASFAAINADDFYGAHSFRLLYDYLSAARDSSGVYDYCMVSYSLQNTLSEYGHVARGICSVSEGDDLEGIVERTKIRRFDGEVRWEDTDGSWHAIAADSVVSMNMFGFTRSFLDELGKRFPQFLSLNIANPKAEFFLPTVINDLIGEKKARVRVLRTPDRWLGMTYREDTDLVRGLIRDLVDSGAYPEKLWT